VRGLKDVSAIIVDIAGVDPKSRVLLDNSAQVSPPNDNITLLVGSLSDYGGQGPGGLLAQWRTTLDNVIATGQIGTVSVPRPAIQGVRLHERYFYLNQ
jgi:hypothetical protein